MHPSKLQTVTKSLYRDGIAKHVSHGRCMRELNMGRPGYNAARYEIPASIEEGEKEREVAIATEIGCNISRMAPDVLYEVDRRPADEAFRMLHLALEYSMHARRTVRCRIIHHFRKESSVCFVIRNRKESYWYPWFFISGNCSISFPRGALYELFCLRKLPLMASIRA